MCLLFVIFALAALVSPGEGTSLEEFEEQLNFLKTKMEESDIYFKTKIETIESSEATLREQIEVMEVSENKMKKKIEIMDASENKMKKKIEIMEANENKIKERMDNLEMKLETKTENSKKVEKQEIENKGQPSILHKITNNEIEENLFKINAEEMEYKLGNKEGNNTEDRLAYLEELSKLQLRRSCQELSEYGVIMDNFYYVDPDGPLVGSPPIRVWCEFNKNGQAVTEVLHNSEEKIDVDHCHDPGCYVRPIVYSAPDFQIQSLMKISEHCEQSVEYNCLMAPLLAQNVEFGFWLDTHGQAQYYWDGAHSSQHVCRCYFSEAGCLEESTRNTTCNCDAGVPELQSDVGVITNSSALPVSQLQFGGLTYEMQQASHKLGRLRCWGQAQFEAGTSCTAIKKAGEFRSGYYNVKKTEDANSQLVFCKASPGYQDNNDEVYIESSEDHFQGVESTISEIETEVSDVAGQVSTLEEKMADVLKRSDFCSYQDDWYMKYNQVITFEKLMLDNNNIPGAQMDIAKGEFTAGVTGIYRIDVFMWMYGDTRTDREVFLRLNGANMPEYKMHSYSDNGWIYDNGGMHTMVRLNAGDVMSVYVGYIWHLNDVTFCISLTK